MATAMHCYSRPLDVAPVILLGFNYEAHKAKENANNILISNLGDVHHPV